MYTTTKIIHNKDNKDMIVSVFVMFAHRFPWLQPSVNFFSRAGNCHVLI